MLTETWFKITLLFEGAMVVFVLACIAGYLVEAGKALKGIQALLVLLLDRKDGE